MPYAIVFEDHDITGLGHSTFGDIASRRGNLLPAGLVLIGGPQGKRIIGEIHRIDLTIRSAHKGHTLIIAIGPYRAATMDAAPILAILNDFFGKGRGIVGIAVANGWRAPRAARWIDRQGI